MKTKNTFDFSRFYMICKQSVILNQRNILYSFIGIFGITMFITLFMINMMKGYDHWTNNDYFGLFILLFTCFGIIYNGMAFVGFRAKEKTISYLTLPASVTEKYVLEFVSRLIIYIVAFPVVYWLTANLAGLVTRLIHPDFEHFSFSFSYITDKIVFDDDWKTASFMSFFWLLFVTSFLGGTLFEKNPLIKMLFTVTISIIANFLLGYGLNKWLLLSQYSHPNAMLGKMNISKFLTIVFSISSLYLLIISFLKVKEKEV